MPRSAIAAGLADVVASVEELPHKITAYLKHTPARREPVSQEEKAMTGVGRVLILLRARTGHDFSMYKRSTITRRIERRMGLHQLDSIANYVRLLQESPQELDLLFKELLIGVTSFFRDPVAWEQLKHDILPALVGFNPGRQMLRAWIPGCSSGEEAYSLAIVFKEVLEEIKPAKGYTLQIFGTDLDRDAIDRARAGAYPASVAANVSSERLRRFFVEEENGYRVGKDIREMAIFAPQNVIMDPPFTKLDLVICRNLLIYLNAELQSKLLPLFHYALNPRGILFLGNAETVGSATDLFTPIEGKSRIYRRLDAATRVEPVVFPASVSPASGGKVPQVRPVGPADLQAITDHVVLQRYAPAAVLVNHQGDILYISGRTGKYLEPAAGKANWNIFAMAREGLRFEIAPAFRKAIERNSAVVLNSLKVGTNGGVLAVDVMLDPVQEPEALRGTVMVVFKDVPSPPEGKVAAHKSSRGQDHDARLVQALEELERTRHELRTAREEMQTSEEELKSANEELQSTNEELQSTNEELTTSKEELQSLNEELQTVNNELQAKVDELSRASNDMRNLLNSTEIAVVFLDNAFRVRRFTTQASQIIKLIPGDAGRPFTDIASDLVYPELIEDAQEVLRTLASTEKTIGTRDGRWFTARIMPYRTLDNKIDGVVITFLDVTVHKGLETRLHDAEKKMEEQARQQGEALADAQRRLRTDAQGRHQPEARNPGSTGHDRR
jgi:two-component system CheB/CheR fusion protein